MNPTASARRKERCLIQKGNARLGFSRICLQFTVDPCLTVELARGASPLDDLHMCSCFWEAALFRAASIVVVTIPQLEA
jgi:hypothetical protein